MNYLSSQIYILFCKNDDFGVHALCIPKERIYIYTHWRARLIGYCACAIRLFMG